MVGSYGPFSDGHYEDSRLGFGTKVVMVLHAANIKHLQTNVV